MCNCFFFFFSSCSLYLHLLRIKVIISQILGDITISVLSTPYFGGILSLISTGIDAVVWVLRQRIGLHRTEQYSNGNVDDRL